MTVSYQYDVASSSTGGFFRLLWRWRGSIWKLLYKELLLFSAVYLSIAFSYDFLMTDYYKRYYERIVIFCSAFVEIIPLSFILGFYVSFTATRWWQQYTAIPWPDKLMNIIALYVPGNDVTSRVLRRTLMRYLNLTLVLVLRSISIPVKRRFPTKEHLVEAGFMSRPELEMYSSVPSHEFNTFWIPCTWFVNLLREAKSECRITDSGGIKLIMEEFNDFRSKCGLLWSYDWVSIPLVYTQVVTLSTQAFFLASLLGRQHINPPKDQDVKSHIYGEYYIPVFTLLQFILYMGLLKLGEQLINPFGDDDEDFELNWIIDRHLKVSFLGVDILNSDPPPLIKDNYFDEMDIKLPYTEAAVAHKVKTYRGSVAAFHVPTEKHGLVIPEFEDENGEEEDECASTIQSQRERETTTSRTSSWNVFSNRKRKLSSSIDSFNSETMVETGLVEESEMPTLQPNSWSSFLISERSAHKGKGSVWPKEKAPEGTQGIWGHSDGRALPKDAKMPTSTDLWKPVPAETSVLSTAESELVKQSSFSTSDSSIVIPLGEEPDRRTSSNSTSKFFGFRKSPLQVFSKEFVNAPMSAFKSPNEASPRNSGDRSSLSSCLSVQLQKPEQKPVKHPKSLMKCHRAVDPKLKIRPFQSRSKVTFSEDTKAGDNSAEATKSETLNKTSYPSKWDSSSDSVSSMRRESGEETISLKRHHTFSTPAVPAQRQSPLKVLEPPFADLSKRRQSFDPALCRTCQTPKSEEQQQGKLTKDNWLHYQSLPNIQEEDLLQTQSPTESTVTDTLYGNNSSPSFPLKVPFAAPTATTQGVLLSPQFSFDQTWQGRRRTIKRQKSQDLGDEDLFKSPKLPPPPKLSSINYLKKQSSDESQNSNVTDNSSSSNQQKPSTVYIPPGILRRPKEDLKPGPRQASTESDTGSYHTVNSFLMQVEKSNSSSIDSFTSAVSESLNSSTQSRPDLEPSGDQQPVNGTPRYLSSFSPIESSLVPTITFSQSTPSVTSQSSDDQNSPRWDEKYPEFSSMETVMDASYHGQPHQPPTRGSLPRQATSTASGRAPLREALHPVSLRATPHQASSSSSSSVSSSQSSSHPPCESLHLTIQDPSEEPSRTTTPIDPAATNLHSSCVDESTAKVANNRSHHNKE